MYQFISLTGIKGDRGVPGAAGYEGTPGFAGDKGTPGPTGLMSQGWMAKGDRGDRGPTGEFYKFCLLSA